MVQQRHSSWSVMCYFHWLGFIGTTSGNNQTGSGSNLTNSSGINKHSWHSPSTLSPHEVTKIRALSNTDRAIVKIWAIVFCLPDILVDIGVITSEFFFAYLLADITPTPTPPLHAENKMTVQKWKSWTWLIHLMAYQLFMDYFMA